MNNKDKKAIECIKFLNEYCKEKEDYECENCHLRNYSGCFAKGRNNTFAFPNKWVIPSLNPKLSDAEKAILLNLDPKYKWMARDAGGDIYIHSVLPQKESTYWNSEQNCIGWLNVLFPDLFAWCSWEDEEPWYIPDLLKEK